MTKNIVILVLIFIIVLFLGRNIFWQPYSIGSEIIGTIEEIIVEEKFLFDDQFVVIREIDPEVAGNSYEIPVDNFDDYEVGQTVKVIVYDKTDEDVWDLDDLKFDIYVLEQPASE